MPALWHVETNDGEQEISELVTKQEPVKALFVLQSRLPQAKEALVISEHFLNPEALFVPGNGLTWVGERGAQVPDFVAKATDDDVDGDRMALSIADV